MATKIYRATADRDDQRTSADQSVPNRIVTIKQPILWHYVRMPDERPLTLHQIDQARGDLYAIADDLEFIKSQLARVPTRMELARMALLATLTTAAIVLAGMEALFR
jgi:hypothetical protein